MAESSSAPRRVRVERAIYRRSTGVLEICFKDEGGRLRWRTVDGGILAARKLRDDIAARKARGDQSLRTRSCASAKLPMRGSQVRSSTCEIRRR